MINTMHLLTLIPIGVFAFKHHVRLMHFPPLQIPALVGFAALTVANLLDCQWFVRREHHDVPPRFVNGLKHLGSCRQLSDDIGRPENRLEVHPRTLAGLPLVQRFLFLKRIERYVFPE